VRSKTTHYIVTANLATARAAQQRRLTSNTALVLRLFLPNENPVKIRSVLLTSMLSLMLVACTEANQQSAELSGLNYTDVFISTSSVDGHHGPGIFANGGEGTLKKRRPSFYCRRH
jgi:hypothetical protein